MGDSNTAFLRRLGCCRIPTILSICAVASQAGVPPVYQDWIQSKPSFERAGPERFLWRHSETLVVLGHGGQLSALSGGRRRFRLYLVGANSRSSPRGEGLAPARLYYLGDARNWRVVSPFERVRYSDVYPGIDLVFLTAGDHLEYNFEVAPFADANRIRIRCEGCTLGLSRKGDLQIRANASVTTQRSPSVFQNESGRQREIACAYALGGRQEAFLRLGAYDHFRSLFIDPVLDFGTYLGGSSYDSINAAAVDAQGNLYVAGETSSGSLTTPPTAARFSRDVFVAKFNSAGNQVSAVYLGGGSYDSGRGIALDPSGNIYVTGMTESSDFPITSGAFSSKPVGVQNIFVAKFHSNLALQYSTYLSRNFLLLQC